MNPSVQAFVHAFYRDQHLLKRKNDGSENLHTFVKNIF